MQISSMYTKERPLISFEVFPPKADYPVDTLFETLEHLKTLSPGFISVTYGAGGSNQGRTIEIASAIKNRYRLEPLAHLTCVGASPEKIDEYMSFLSANHIENILALRGDVPLAFDGNPLAHYTCAADLIRHIKGDGRFCIGAAVHPETHYESLGSDKDLAYIKKKIDAGADFLITQMFFDNNAFFGFLESLRKADIHVPVSAGLMPVLDSSQILRMTSLCGCSIPASLSRLIARYGHSNESFTQAGIDYACGQFASLYKAGVDGIHLYTMNKWQQIETILHRCLQ
ncbi:MAG: methylenetetrahydrofolate reductase [Christensenellales bacterium]